MSSTFLTFFNIFFKLIILGFFSYLILIFEVAILNDMGLLNHKKILTYYFITYIILVIGFFLYMFKEKKT